MKKLLFVTISILLFGCILSPHHEVETIKMDSAIDTTKADSAIYPDKKPDSMQGAK